MTPAPARAAAFDYNDETWEGSSDFWRLARRQLGDERVKVTSRIEWNKLRPKDALLILHPTRQLEYREVAAFLAAGGRLAVLDDYGQADSLLERFRIRRVGPPLHPAEKLRDNPQLPIAVPAVADPVAGREQVRHPIVAGVDQLVTNHPTGLSTEAGVRLTPVLRIKSTKEDPDTLLAVLGVIGDARRCGLTDAITERPAAGTALEPCGRLFAMGDPSAVINRMIQYPGNQAFAAGVVDYLVADDAWGERGGILYLIANDFSQHDFYGGASGLRRAVDDRIEALGELVSETRDQGLPDPLALALAAIAALGAVIWTARAATRVYRRPPPHYARPTPLVAQGGVAGRAAVLSAPTTHRALAVLELKAALEEALRSRLDLPPMASPAQILEDIEARRALDRKSLKILAELFSEMARAEQAVATSQRLRVPLDAVLSMHNRLKAILDELDRRLEEEA